MYDFETGDKTQYFGPTNGATINATIPVRADYNMPYVYDSFDWDHCVSEESEINGDINAKLLELYTSSR